MREPEETDESNESNTCANTCAMFEQLIEEIYNPERKTEDDDKEDE